jgi:hypothetical protein
MLEWLRTGCTILRGSKTMAAIDHVADALAGIAKCAGDQRAEKRCAESGNPAVVITPQGHPVLREWDYAEGAVLVFTEISSCLGAVQLTGRNTLRGIHVSLALGDKVSLALLTENFDRAMGYAGFKQNAPIYYFGNNLTFWSKGVGVEFQGLGHSRWIPWEEAANAPRLPGFIDQDTQRWIFETTGNDVSQVTCHAF